MDLDRFASTTAAWLDVWRHGSAHPTVVQNALQRLAAQALEPETRAVIAQARMVVAAIPYGSVQPFAA